MQFDVERDEAVECFLVYLVGGLELGEFSRWILERIEELDEKVAQSCTGKLRG